MANPTKQRKDPNHSKREKNPVSSWINRQYHGTASFLVRALSPY